MGNILVKSRVSRPAFNNNNNNDAQLNSAQVRQNGTHGIVHDVNFVQYNNYKWA